MKKQKGITLIALVITIIVLLILAGVSISMVIGNNGILSQASTAGRDTKRATEKEQVEMAFVAAKMKHLRGEISAIDATALATELKQFGLIEGTDFTVSKDGEILTVKFLKSGNEYPIENEIVKPNYKDDVVTPQEPEQSEKMYNVEEDVTPSPQELFNIAVLDETAKTAEITGMNPEYIGKNSAMDYFYDDEYFYAYHAINYSGLIDTLVIPYEVIPEGKDEPYTVTKVNLSCSKTDEYNYGCKFPAVNTIIYPNTVTTMAVSSDLPWVASVRNIILSDNITVIPNDAFRDCFALETIILPKNMQTMGNYAFYGTGLREINIPNGCTNISDRAFMYCSKLEKLTIPSSVTSIGSTAFFRAFSLSSIYIDEQNTKYDSRNNCNAIIETATNTLVYGCKNTIIPSTVTSIGNDAFEECKGLKSITIPNNVKSIGNDVFKDCSDLTSITIPSSVTSIGDSVLSGCSNLTTVIYQGTEEQWNQISIGNYNSVLTSKVTFN